jgi:hypothetical protein
MSMTSLDASTSVCYPSVVCALHGRAFRHPFWVGYLATDAGMAEKLDERQGTAVDVGDARFKTGV